MKKITILLLVALLGFCGCTTTPTAPGTTPPTPAQFAAAVIEPLATGIVPLVLAKNPSYVGAVDAVAVGLPVLLAGVDLTPENITAALTTLNTHAHLGMEPEVVSLIATSLAVAVLEYQRAYGVRLALHTAPDVQLVLNAFSRGLINGVAIYRAAHPPTPSP